MFIPNRKLFLRVLPKACSRFYTNPNIYHTRQSHSRYRRRLLKSTGHTTVGNFLVPSSSSQRQLVLVDRAGGCHFRYDVHMWPARGGEQAGFNARQHCLPTSQRPRPLSYYAVRSRYPTYPLRHRAGFGSCANSNSSSNAVGGSKGTDEPCRPDWFLLQTLLLQQQQ